MGNTTSTTDISVVYKNPLPKEPDDQHDVWIAIVVPCCKPTHEDDPSSDDETPPPENELSQKKARLSSDEETFLLCSKKGGKGYKFFGNVLDSDEYRACVAQNLVWRPNSQMNDSCSFKTDSDEWTAIGPDDAIGSIIIDCHHVFFRLAWTYDALDGVRQHRRFSVISYAEWNHSDTLRQQLCAELNRGFDVLHIGGSDLIPTTLPNSLLPITRENIAANLAAFAENVIDNSQGNK